MLTETKPEYITTGPIVYTLKGPNVDIVFADVNQAHRWAETRFGPGEAWTVTETYIWTEK